MQARVLGYRLNRRALLQRTARLSLAGAGLLVASGCGSSSSPSFSANSPLETTSLKVKRQSLCSYAT